MLDIFIDRFVWLHAYCFLECVCSLQVSTKIGTLVVKCVGVGLGVAKSENKIQNQKWNGNIVTNYSPSSQTTVSIVNPNSHPRSQRP